MNNDKFINAKQIAQELDISDSYGYKIIRQLNAEYIIFRIPVQEFFIHEIDRKVKTR